MADEIVLCDCGHPSSKHSDFTTGYGVDRDTNKTYCYQCCAKQDIENMIATGEVSLYIDREKKLITNWPGSLTFTAIVWKGHHNWGCKQWYARFIGPDGKVWTGRNVSDGYNDIIHCKRTKLESIYA